MTLERKIGNDVRWFERRRTNVGTNYASLFLLKPITGSLNYSGHTGKFLWKFSDGEHRKFLKPNCTHRVIPTSCEIGLNAVT